MKASSNIHKSYFDLILSKSSKSTHLPAKLTGIILKIREKDSNSFSQILNQSSDLGSISAKTTSPPQYLTQFAEATKDIGEVVTLLPGLTFNDMAHKCKAAVPFDTATAYLEFTYFANFFQIQIL